MKTTNNLFILCTALVGLLLLSACELPPPSYLYIPPQHKDVRACFAQCSKTQETCVAREEERFLKCKKEHQFKDKIYEDCEKANDNGQGQAFGCVEPPICIPFDKYQCLMDYNACYEKCGGDVIGDREEYFPSMTD